jgi:flagellin
LNQAVRNANDAISMIQVAEGAMKEVTNMFQRMRELAVQAISDSNTSADRTALNNEYKQLSYEVSRVAENTQWNGTNILDGARTQTTFQIGANASQTIAVNFGDLSASHATTVSTVTDGLSAAKASATITITGDVAAGDQLTFKTDKLDASGNATYYTQAIDATLAGKINGTDTDGTMGADVALSAGTYALTTTGTGGVIKIEADAVGVETFSISDVVVTRGLHKTSRKVTS